MVNKALEGFFFQSIKTFLETEDLISLWIISLSLSLSQKYFAVYFINKESFEVDPHLYVWVQRIAHMWPCTPYRTLK